MPKMILPLWEYTTRYTALTIVARDSRSILVTDLLTGLKIGN